MKDRILSLLGTINKGIYEKETELSLSLMAALAGESVILLGPPGVAKSMVARRLKLAFKDARSFEYLMSRFSTPDEIFGPVSISKLKDADKYERNTEGYLPTADVVFLDEIWKAGPAIQNTLLTVINEKLFRNGDTEVHLPLKLLLAASNELPTQGEGLEALWDRFIIRIECGNIKDVKGNIKDVKCFNAMLLDNTADGDIEVADGLQISDEEYCRWNKVIDTVAVSEEVLRIINVIRKSLGSVTIAQNDERHNVYVSDRRWKKIVRLLRTSAFVHDRTEVTADDLLPVYNCLWQEPEECEGIRAIVIRALYNDLTMEFASLRKNLENDIRVSRQHRATNRARQNMQLFDTNKKIYDNYYYHLLDHDTGNTYVLVADPRGASSVYLTRDEECIYINGVRFYIETLGRGEQQTLPTKKGSVSGRDFYEELEQLSTQIRQRTDAIHGNIFVSETDKKEVDEFVKNLFTEIAHTRQDMEKLEE